MKKIIYAVLVIVAIMAIAVSARKTVNTYVIPEYTEYQNYGSDFENNWKKVDTILTGAATILSTKGADGINVSHVVADTVRGLSVIRGNPNIDSCALSVVSGNIAASGSITLARSLRLSGTAGDTITAIQRLVNTGGADSIRITIGGVALKIACDVE